MTPRDRGIAATDVDVRVLGPLEMRREGEQLALGGPKQRTVLGLLVAAGDRAVTVDTLIDGVWGDAPPDSARSTLQSYVSNLRGALGDVIVREGDGYHLQVPREQVDVWRFERTLTEARGLLDTDPAGAAETFGDALALWRGRPYEGVARSERLAAEARRLEELRLGAVEDRMEAELSLGRHSSLVSELEALTAEHPLRERLRAQHMLALYRSGRQADALGAFERARDRLVDELGIDPSPTLRDLHQRILAQDAALELDADTDAPPRGDGERGETERLVFLFTDIEGSTPLWERDPEAMAEAVEIHDRVITAAVEDTGGEVVARSGDEMDATFEHAGEAVAAAEAAQRALREADWGDTGPLKVRMGIDVGEVESRAGKYFGSVLNRLGRIIAAGHGGQVLLSGEAAEALDDAGLDVELRDLGEHRFKGLGRPQRVLQLVADGLPSDFGELRLDRSPVRRGGLIRTVRGYELRELLGEGDFGAVYRAYQSSVGREVAVKAIRAEYADHPVFVRRFEAEAQFIAQLEHPHIVALYDYWREPEAAYLVMPLLRGGSLADALRRGPWNLGPALRLLDQVGSALSYAHRSGIVHRDVKPGNVLLDEDGNAYLSDFGIASRLSDEAGGVMTSSLPYVPPEELRGEPLEATADIFSLGVLVFELLTGARPTGRELPALAEARPDLPAELGAVLRTATDDRPSERYERVEDLLRAVRQAVGSDVVAVASPEPRTATTAPVRNPYKGLRAFQETDAGDFYGRDALIDELLQAVSNERLVAVVGASGSGKSSLVRAGLVPALRAGGLPGSRAWLISDMFPGSYPFEELEAALLRVAVTNPGGLVEELRADERGLLRVTKQILPRDDSELVLIVDQFEELFSLTDHEATRRLFLDAIHTLVTDERSRVRVVVTMRADFFDRPLDYPGFAELFKTALVAVTPPSEESLGLAISRPAHSVGLDLEPGLVGEIIADVTGQPGGLPLMQYALTELFQTRDGDRLTVSGYRATGGVAGVLGRRAEELFQGLSPAGKTAAKQIFLRLVTVDEETDDTRRRVSQRELEGLHVEPEILETVLQQYASYRLLTYDRDPATRIPTVEVAHEALIREWDRLRAWIDEQRHDLIFHRRFQAELRAWEEADRDPSYLITGGRLEEAERWAADSGITLSEPEEDYLETSRQMRAEDEAAARRRRRRVIVGLITGLVAVSVLAAVALVQRQAADQERLAAEHAERQATVRQLAGAATVSLAEDPERAILLALESAYTSLHVGEELLPETVAALHRSVQTSRLELRVDGGHAALAVSHDGTLFATGVLDPGGNVPSEEVLIRDVSTGEVVRTVTGDGSAMGLAFSPTEPLLAVGVGHRGGEEPSPVRLYDLTTGEQVGEIGTPAHVLPATVIADRPLAWSPSGERIAAVSRDGADGVVTVVEVASAAEVTTVPTAGQPIDVAFADETTLLVSEPGRVAHYDLTSGEETGELATGLGFGKVVVERDLGRLVVGSQNEREIQGWDLASGDQLWSTETTTNFVQDIDPNTRTVAIGGNTGELTLLDVDDGSEVLDLLGHTGAVWGAAFAPTGGYLVSVSGEGEIRVWDVTSTGPSDVGALEVGAAGAGVPSAISVSPDGSAIAVTYGATGGGSFRVIDRSSGEVLGSLADPHVGLGWIDAAQVARDWSLMAWVDAEGAAWTGDLTDDGAERVALPPCTIPKALSDDGSAVLLDGVRLCGPDDAPEGAELRSRVVDPSSGDELYDLGERFAWGPGHAFNPDGALEGGRYLATLDVAGESVELHDLVAGNLVARVHLEGEIPFILAFDPGGRHLAIGTQHGRTHVLDVSGLVEGTPVEDAVIFRLVAHTGGVPGIALSGDGVLATSGFGSLRLWDIHRGEEIVDVTVDTDEPPRAAFGPDDVLLYGDRSPFGDIVIRRIHLDHDELVALAESRVTRELTDDERLRYVGSVDR